MVVNLIYRHIESYPCDFRSHVNASRDEVKKIARTFFNIIIIRCGLSSRRCGLSPSLPHYLRALSPSLPHYPRSLLSIYSQCRDVVVYICEIQGYRQYLLQEKEHHMMNISHCFFYEPRLLDWLTLQSQPMPLGQPNQPYQRRDSQPWPR